MTEHLKVRKIKPQCPMCKTIGNMAGSDKGELIFCATCGSDFTKEQVWEWMKKNGSR